MCCYKSHYLNLEQNKHGPSLSAIDIRNMQQPRLVAKIMEGHEAKSNFKVQVVVIYFHALESQW